MNPLLQDIETFLQTHSATLSATAFGELAMNDRHLVRQMRGGRRIWPETEAKIRRFMATYKPEQEAA
jgi:predicted phage gp36 major capsid-like protein